MKDCRFAPVSLMDVIKAEHLVITKKDAKPLLSKNEIRERNQVNYDALLEAGALDLETIVNRIARKRDMHFDYVEKRVFTKEKRYGYLAEVRNPQLIAGLRPAPGGWRNHYFSSVEDPDRQTLKKNAGRYMKFNELQLFYRNKQHVRMLVGRCLQGLEVPMDVQRHVDEYGLSPKRVVTRAPKKKAKMKRNVQERPRHADAARWGKARLEFRQ